MPCGSDNGSGVDVVLVGKVGGIECEICALVREQVVRQLVILFLQVCNLLELLVKFLLVDQGIAAEAKRGEADDQACSDATNKSESCTVLRESTHRPAPLNISTIDVKSTTYGRRNCDYATRMLRTYGTRKKFARGGTTS